jgi:hypothetical protein
MRPKSFGVTGTSSSSPNFASGFKRTAWARVLVLRIGNAFDDNQLRDGTDIAGAGINLHAKLPCRADSLSGSGEKRAVDGLKKHLTLDPFIAFEKVQSGKDLVVHSSGWRWVVETGSNAGGPAL